MNVNQLRIVTESDKLIRAICAGLCEIMTDSQCLAYTITSTKHRTARINDRDDRKRCLLHLVKPKVSIKSFLMTVLIDVVHSRCRHLNLFLAALHILKELLVTLLCCLLTSKRWSILDSSEWRNLLELDIVITMCWQLMLGGVTFHVLVVLLLVESPMCCNATSKDSLMNLLFRERLFPLLAIRVLNDVMGCETRHPFLQQISRIGFWINLRLDVIENGGKENVVILKHLPKVVTTTTHNNLFECRIDHLEQFTSDVLTTYTITRVANELRKQLVLWRIGEFR